MHTGLTSVHAPRAPRALSPNNGKLSPPEAGRAPALSGRREAPFRIIPDAPFGDPRPCQRSELLSLALCLRNGSSAWADAPGNNGRQLSPPSARFKILLPQPVDPGWASPRSPQMSWGSSICRGCWWLVS